MTDIYTSKWFNASCSSVWTSPGVSAVTNRVSTSVEWWCHSSQDFLKTRSNCPLSAWTHQISAWYLDVWAFVESVGSWTPPERRSQTHRAAQTGGTTPHQVKIKVEHSTSSAFNGSFWLYFFNFIASRRPFLRLKDVPNEWKQWMCSYIHDYSSC